MRRKINKFLNIILLILAFIFSLDLFVLYARPLKNVEILVEENSINLDSNLFTRKENNDVVNQTINDLDGNYIKKLENNNFELFTNIKTGALRVKNKNTSYFWSSDVINANSYDFNNANLKKVQSAFRIVYRDKDSKVKEVLTSDAQVDLNEVVIDNSIIYSVNLKNANISFSYKITLNDEGFNLFLDYNSIKENENLLTSITFFPYMASVYKETIPGYIFVPSGSGALIRYSNNSLITSTYESSFYGNDANINKTINRDKLSLPIYGYCHGVKQNAMLVEIKEGATFAKFIYSPPSIDQNFNLAYLTFNYRETYSFQIPGSETILVVPQNFIKDNISIDYTILSNDDASYVGMAKCYQDKLIKRNIINKKSDSRVDLHLDCFGLDYEKSIIFKKNHKMTTTKDILNIDKELKENNINDIFYTLRAFNNGGYSNQKSSNYSFDSSLGKISDLKQLETYYYYNPVESYRDQRNYPRGTLVNLYNEKTSFQIEENKYLFLSDVNRVVKYTKKALNKYNNIALDGLGFYLYGDNNNNYSRKEALSLFDSLLYNKKIPFYKPNYYYFDNTSKYLMMPLTHDRCRFFTDSIPFLEILLKGYIDYYSPFLNFSSNTSLDILRCIEFGCNPAYLITEKESHYLSNSLSNNYYATFFKGNKDSIISNYDYIKKALDCVADSSIVNREIIEVGISEVTYSNGKIIVCNYTNDIYLYKGESVPAFGYKVI